MKYLQVIILLSLTLAVIGFKTNGNLKHLKLSLTEGDMKAVKEKMMEQPLDHFDPHENRTFKMRYFENFQFWKPNGPAYVYIGGEGEVDGKFIGSYTNLLITQLAKETNGAMFATEHRYYGESLPDIPKDDKIKYFKYLSSKQALADIAFLIMKLKSDSKFSSSPVVVVGGSYAGNLAAWMRELYPHMVDAAIASSAPVLAKKDFHDYLDVVRQTFAKYGTKNCLQNIEKKFKHVEELLKSSDGIEKIKEEFNICPYEDLTKLEKQRCLFDLLYGSVKSAAQYGQVYNVKQVCDNYEPTKKLTFDNSSNLNVQDNGKPTCMTLESCLKLDNHNDMAWTYQYCNEFGYLQTTSSEKQPFVHWSPLEYWFKHCKGLVEGDIEKRIDEGVTKTNKMYGGLSPKVSKVVFTHGDMDPWHSIGVQTALGPEAPVVMSNASSHCGILVEIYKEPADMKEKRKYVKEFIKKWISN
ncbi:putative serine protease K12H4.7 [Leguminivora glycinivorella]|uniref:putative serine protease K12H4.7 n=1 Tax=Leguminivora glycinivorella TaxID=1035111 RepID=UPI00200E7D27|nr:putative serine protease K12H4.7 [Leguminivora glycinivorella]